MTTIEKDLFLLIKTFVTFPFPQICVHLASLEIVQILIKNEIDVPEDLISSLSSSSNGDEKSLEVLNSIINNS